MKLLIIIAGIFLSIFFYSCKKDQAAELQTSSSCANITTTIPDSLTALLTAQTSSAVYIAKITNGVTTTLAMQSGYEFWGPCISPDKTKFICFRSTTGDPDKINDFTHAELWLFNIDGSNGHLLTTRSAQSLNAMGMAKWAPDGLHIVFAGEKNETDGNLHWNIYLTDTLGTLGIKMNTRLGSFKYPTFANGDMTKLTYEAWVVGVVNSGGVFDTELHLATVSGAFQFTAESKLTNNDFLEYAPSFSPDNSQIVYSQNTSLVANTAVELHTIYCGSGSTSTLISDNTINENPVWCTTNSKIYFLNKPGTMCFERANRIDPSGLNNAVVYQQMNVQFLQIDIK